MRNRQNHQELDQGVPNQMGCRAPRPMSLFEELYSSSFGAVTRKNLAWQQDPHPGQAMGAALLGYADELVHTDTPEEFSGVGPEQQGQGLHVKVYMVVGCS